MYKCRGIFRLVVPLIWSEVSCYICFTVHTTCYMKYLHIRYIYIFVVCTWRKNIRNLYPGIPLHNNFFFISITDYQKCVSVRQQLDAQMNENSLVKEVSLQFYSELIGSKNDNIKVIPSEIQEFPFPNWSKSTSSSSKFTSSFLLWWRKTPWQY